MDKNRDPLRNGRDLLLAAFVAVFGVATVALGFVKIANDISEPFDSQVDAGEYVIPTTQNQLAIENTEKAGRDTDGDGINDFDEEFIYGTSPYLKDTDSDERSDKEEIDAGENPLCPHGQTCNTPYQGTDDEAVAAAEPTIAEIRQMLVDSTELSEETVAKFTDEELIALYEETIAEIGNPFDKTQTGSTIGADTGYENLPDPELTTLPGTDVAITDIGEVKDMSPAEIRQFLIAIGLTEEELAGIDDDVLKGLVVEMIEKQTGTTTTQDEDKETE